jgi:hypothetical protein
MIAFELAAPTSEGDKGILVVFIDIFGLVMPILLLEMTMFPLEMVMF